MIVPHLQESNPQPSLELLQTVKGYLEPRRLLTTQVHVVGPRYLRIGVQFTLVLQPDALEDQVRSQAIAALQQFFHPLQGGPEGKGWPFGRNVYVSEIYELLDTQPGVDYVKKTEDLDELTTNEPLRLKRQPNIQGELQLVGVEIQPDELVDAQINPGDITLITPVKTLITGARSGE